MDLWIQSIKFLTILIFFSSIGLIKSYLFFKLYLPHQSGKLNSLSSKKIYFMDFFLYYIKPYFQIFTIKKQTMILTIAFLTKSIYETNTIIKKGGGATSRSLLKVKSGAYWKTQRCTGWSLYTGRRRLDSIRRIIYNGCEVRHRGVAYRPNRNHFRSAGTPTIFFSCIIEPMGKLSYVTLDPIESVHFNWGFESRHGAFHDVTRGFV